MKIIIIALLALLQAAAIGKSLKKMNLSKTKKPNANDLYMQIEKEFNEFEHEIAKKDKEMNFFHELKLKINIKMNLKKL